MRVGGCADGAVHLARSDHTQPFPHTTQPMPQPLHLPTLLGQSNCPPPNKTARQGTHSKGGCHVATPKTGRCCCRHQALNGQVNSKHGRPAAGRTGSGHPPPQPSPHLQNPLAHPQSPKCPVHTAPGTSSCMQRGLPTYGKEAAALVGPNSPQQTSQIHTRQQSAKTLTHSCTPDRRTGLCHVGVRAQARGPRLSTFCRPHKHRTALYAHPFSHPQAPLWH